MYTISFASYNTIGKIFLFKKNPEVKRGQGGIRVYKPRIPFSDDWWLSPSYLLTSIPPGLEPKGLC
jgi:hypothetical protein